MMKQYALQLAELGIPVFPVVGKIPATKNGFKDATTDEARINHWWSAHPTAGIGMPTGKVSGLWVLDIDGEHGRWTLADIIANNSQLPKTIRARTGGNGDHYFFKWEHPIKNSVSKIGPKIDVRGDGGYVVLPPSPHPSGRRYEWVESILDCEAALAPDWLKEGLDEESEGRVLLSPVCPASIKNPSAYAKTALEHECKELAETEEGRNHRLNLSAYKIGRYVSHGYLKEDFAIEELRKAARESGLDEHEILPTIRSGLGAWPPIPKKDGVAVSEDGRIIVKDVAPMRLAEVFLEHQKKNGALTLRRWQERFYRYDGKRFCEVSDETVEGGIWRFLDKIYYEDKEGEIKKHDVNTKRASNVLKAIKSFDVLIDDDAEAPFFFSGASHTDTLSIENGIVHLPTGNVRPHTPDFFTESTVPVTYQEYLKQKTPHWDAFLNSVWPEDDGQKELLQEWFGYCLTSDTSLQKIMLLLGPPGAGKGTVVRVLQALVGEQNITNPTMAQYASQFGLQELPGKLVAVTPDARVSKKTDTTTILERWLSISGEDKLNIDVKFRKPSSRRIKAKLMVLSNDVPEFIDPSGAIARRLIALQFNKSFDGNEDVNLTSKLLGELSGIFAWAIEGFRRMRKRGKLISTQTSTDINNEFLDSISPIRGFLEDRCDTGRGNAMTCARVYDEWEKYRVENGIDEFPTRSSFGRGLKSTYPTMKRRKMRISDSGPYVWFYVGLQTKKVS